MAKSVTVTIARSSHPEFDFYMDVRSGGKQLRLYQGTKAQIDARYDDLATAAQEHDVTVVLINE